MTPEVQTVVRRSMEFLSKLQLFADERGVLDATEASRRLRVIFPMDDEECDSYLLLLRDNGHLRIFFNGTTQRTELRLTRTNDISQPPE